jgi:hypothetical protein
MNISESENSVKVTAKTCSSKEKGIKIIYSFIDAYHSLCIDKRDIIISELTACENLLNQTAYQADKESIEAEIAELKMALDLMH